MSFTPPSGTIYDQPFKTWEDFLHNELVLYPQYWNGSGYSTYSSTNFDALTPGEQKHLRDIYQNYLGYATGTNYVPQGDPMLSYTPGGTQSGNPYSPTTLGYPGTENFPNWGTGGGYSGLGGGGGGGSESFWDRWGGSIITGGANLLGGYLSSQSAQKTAESQREAIEAQISKALAAMSPEQINALMRQYLPQIMAVQNPLQQTAIAGLRSQAARQFGDAASPMSLSAEAGLRGQMANRAVTQAFEQAMTQGQRNANTQLAGIGSIPAVPATDYGKILTDTVNQVALLQALRNPPRSSTSYGYPSNIAGTAQYTPQIPYTTPYPQIAGPQYVPPGGYRI